MPNSDNLKTFALDLADYNSIESFANFVKQSNRTVDFVINNAGYKPKDSNDSNYFQSTFKIEHFSGKNIAESLHINALAPLELTSKLLTSLSDEAVIVNISSWLGSITEKKNPGHYAYAGSKALLNMFTKALSLELAGSDRCTVALNPGWMKTDMGGEKANKTPEDVGELILKMYMDNIFHNSNGKFLNTDGTQHLW